MKILVLALFILACAPALIAQDMRSAQESKASVDELAHFAVAPKERDGIGRAVIAVVDETGAEVRDAWIVLESRWGFDHLCESFGPSNTKGAIALLPIHMGELKLTVKARGFETTRQSVEIADLAHPIQVTLKRH